MNLQSPYTITVINLQGQLLKKIAMNDGSLPVPLEMNDLAEGIYVIDVESMNVIAGSKMLKGNEE